MPEMKTLWIDGIPLKVVDDESVHYTPQELSEAQQTQARQNIGAPAETDIPEIKNELPTVTANDNGKFLRVAGGSWVAATINNAEEASF